MATIIQRAFLQAKSVSVQSVRYRGKINIQRPRKDHYERARLLFATKPVYQEKPYNYKCIQAVTKKQVDNPYDVIIARDAREYFETSKVIAFIHSNPIKGEPYFDARVAFHKQGMKLKVYNRKILKLALGGTKFETVLPLFEATGTNIVFSPEPKIAQIFKIVKKIPQMILLAGIAEDRYLSKNELEALSQMPDLQMTRAQFAAVLDMAGGQLVQNLQAHQTNLVSLLDLHAKSGQNNTETEATTQANSTEG